MRIIMKNIIKLALLLGLTSVLSAGCASGVQKMRKVDPGMDYAQVDAIMGKRDAFNSTEKDGSTYTLYKYTNQLCNGHVSMYDKCDFYITFKDGKVVETGVSDVRGAAPQMQYIHLFTY